MSVVANGLDGLKCYLVWTMEVGLGPGHIVLDGDPAPVKGHSPQFSAHVRNCGQMAGWIKICHLVRRYSLDPGDIVLDGDPVPPPKKKGVTDSYFGQCLLWPNGSPSQ